MRLGIAGQRFRMPKAEATALTSAGFAFSFRNLITRLSLRTFGLRTFAKQIVSRGRDGPALGFRWPKIAVERGEQDRGDSLYLSTGLRIRSRYGMVRQLPLTICRGRSYTRDCGVSVSYPRSLRLQIAAVNMFLQCLLHQTATFGLPKSFHEKVHLPKSVDRSQLLLYNAGILV